MAEAVKCLEIDSKKGGKASDKLREDRTKLIKNLYEVLKDAREREEGGVYQPPTTHVSLQQIKKSNKLLI